DVASLACRWDRPGLDRRRRRPAQIADPGEQRRSRRQLFESHIISSTTTNGRTCARKSFEADRPTTGSARRPCARVPVLVGPPASCRTLQFTTNACESQGGYGGSGDRRILFSVILPCDRIRRIAVPGRP